MERYGENNSAAIKPSSIQGFAMEGGKFTSEIRNNRRPLRDIKNFVNAPLPRAVIKGKPAAEDKSRNFEGHRPMTRKLAASLANKKLSHQDSSQRNGLLDNEICKKAIPNSNDLESTTVIDVDEYMEASEPPLPARENQTEAILEEMESMVGVTNHPSNKENAWLPSFISKRLSSVSGDPDEAPGGPTMIGHPRATLWLDPDHSSPAAHHGVPQKIFQSADRIIQQQDCNPEEVEMEDLEEPVPDIDSCDHNNQLAVVDYVEDIYAFYRQAENSSCVCPKYMSQQSDINEKMRAILIDWLIEVHYKFELMAETLFLTVNLIDRFLERQNVVRKKLQLVGVTAMLLACKYEEVSIPIVEDLITISDRAYTRDEVLAMEKLMINTLQFNMSVPTPYVFMRRFLKAAQSDKTLELLSFFMIELCLVEYEMLKFRPSLLAAAAIYTAQCTLKGFKHWSMTSEWHTRYTKDQLQECSRLMVDFHQNAAAGRLTGVHRKYSTSKFGFAAKSEPACFLLDTRL